MLFLFKVNTHDNVGDEENRNSDDSNGQASSNTIDAEFRFVGAAWLDSSRR